MAGQEKEMGLVDLENFLKQEFPENNKINILLEQISKSKADLEKETGEANPFFYSTISRQMMATSSKGIDSWIDSKGNVNIAQINAVAKIAKKEFEIAKENEINQKKLKYNYQAQILEQQEEIIKQEFEKIDYNNLTERDLRYIANNMALFRDTATYEKYVIGVETIGNVLGVKGNIIEWQKIARYQKDHPNEELSLEQIEILNSVPKELLNEDGKLFNQEKMEVLDILIGCTYNFIERGIDENKLPNQEEIKRYLTIQMDTLQSQFSKELLNQVVTVGILEELKDKSNEEQKAIISRKIQEQNEKRQTKSDISQQQSEKSEERMQEENDRMTANRFAIQRDFYEAEHNDMQVDNLAQEDIEFDDFDGFEKDVFETLDNYYEEAEEAKLDQITEIEEQTYNEEQNEKIVSSLDGITSELEEVQPVIDAEAQEAESYREETTFEDNGPGGILGFLSAMASKFIPKKLQERFMSKDKTKQLSAGEAEVIRKDGIVQKSFYENGTLEPSLFKRFQTKSIEIAGNVMNAISRITGVSDKSEENTIKNRPIVIKSNEHNEQQKAQELSKQQNVNVFDRQNQVFTGQEGAKRDDNPWAVKVNTDMEKVAIAKSNKVEAVVRDNQDTIEVTQEELSEQDDEIR